MPDCDIIVAGHICLDLAPTFFPGSAATLGELLVPGKVVRVDACVTYPGGPVSNTGIALTKIGAKVGLMGKIGDDAFGQIVLQHMQAAGCGAGIRMLPGEVTSYTIVLAPPGIDRVFLHSHGANDTYTADDIAYDRLARVKLFHFGYPPLMKCMYEDEGAELLNVFQRAKACGVTTALDMALPDPDAPSGRVNWHGVLQKVLPHVDIFLPSAEEVLFFLERDNFLAKRADARSQGIESLNLITPEEYSRLSTKLIDYGAGIAALKSGHRGIYLRTGSTARLNRFGRARVGNVANWSGRELWAPAFQVERVANATGSGDCSIAGFLASFMRGEHIAQALTYATAAGRQNVLVYDATSGILSFAQTTAAMKAWHKSALPISAPGWRFDEAEQLWHGPHDGR